MLLSNLIASSDGVQISGPDIDISGLTEDSRKVTSGFLFIATPGVKQDGRAFVQEAIQKGATAVLGPQDLEVPAGITKLTSFDVRKATAELASVFYPLQPSVCVAVTGTSGKTSTAQFTRELWDGMGQPAASVGTLGLVTANDTLYGSLTTPDAITLHRIMNECVQKNLNHVVVEASSHGIELNRLDCVKFKAAGFTNLSRDHLDYHQTMEAYLSAKMRLFAELLPLRAAAILNADIPEFDTLFKAAIDHGLEVMSYGKKGKDLTLLSVSADSHGQKLRLNIFGKEREAILPVMGSFQVWNALCALGLVIGSGSDVDQAIAAMSNLKGVPGRLQHIGVSSKGGTVFVDYAHKPDALENVLQALRPQVEAHPGAKLGVIFGCGGNRDKGKRPIMGGIAQKKADWVIVTDDNPRHEQSDVIRREILAGCSDKSNVTEIGDRAQAIAEGIGRLNQNDVVVIAGKGHEPGQIVGDQVLPFDDADEARKVLGQG